MRSSSPVRKLLRCCLVLTSLFVLVTGCGSSGTVSGKVYYKGKPLPGGSVRFFPEGQGGSFFSAIESDGSYSVSKLPRGVSKIAVMYTSGGDPLAKMNPKMAAGAAKGMKKQQEMMQAKGKGGPPAPTENITVPEKYSDPAKSGLQVDVTGGSKTFDIKID